MANTDHDITITDPRELKLDERYDFTVIGDTHYDNAKYKGRIRRDDGFHIFWRGMVSIYIADHEFVSAKWVG